VDEGGSGDKRPTRRGEYFTPQLFAMVLTITSDEFRQLVRKKGRPPPGGEEAEVVVYQPRGVGLIHTRHKPSDSHYTRVNAVRRKPRFPVKCTDDLENCRVGQVSETATSRGRPQGANWSMLMLCSVTASESSSDDSPAPRPEVGIGRPVPTAAFFDLDKTVIAKSSTLAFSKPFFEQGLISRQTVLKSAYAQFLFLMSGADHEQMDRMRSYITNMCTGWNVDQVKSIVSETLHEIVDPLVFAEAANLIADHRLCGRDVVVVSASGEEIVAPIAKALGATHAMATRMVVEDGKYTGEVAFYCYGEGKVEAIRELAAREGYALEHCYAYSDSVTDLPMLEAVGHPTVVNPDRGLRKEAVARGWPVREFSRPIPLRDRISAPSGAAVATSVAVGVSALAAGALAYSLVRRFVF
jgi:HAD superfamily hydrolase (TIGR01490 family)